MNYWVKLAMMLPEKPLIKCRASWGLGYPGGPAIQKAAQSAEEELQQQHKPVAVARSAYRLPRAWLRGTYDFSFSGLKTAMLHLAEGAT